MGLDEFNAATRMRDVVATISQQVVDSARPAPAYATVSAIDRWRRRATVSFPGETSTVTVSMGTLQPNVVGQTVRIEGTVGDRFVADVVNPPLGNSYSSNDPDTHSYVVAGGFLSEGQTSGVTIAERLPGSSTVVEPPTGTPVESFTLYTAGSRLQFHADATGTNKTVMSIGKTGQTWISRNGHDIALSFGHWLINNPNTHVLILAGTANTGGGTWSASQLNIRNNEVNGEAALSFYCGNYATAPIIRHYGAFGEIVDFMNNTTTAWITIRAAAFTVTSATRFKRDIRAANPLLVGDRSWAKWSGATKRLHPKVWKKLPTVHTNGNVHLCGRDCNKTPQNPCPIGVEDQRDHLGFVAEDVAAVFPEAVTYDLDGTPLAIDYTRLTAALWGAVAELTDRVEVLEARPTVSPPANPPGGR